MKQNDVAKVYLFPFDLCASTARNFCGNDLHIRDNGLD